MLTDDICNRSQRLPAGKGKRLPTVPPHAGGAMLHEHAQLVGKSCIQSISDPRQQGNNAAWKYAVILDSLPI